MKNRGATADHTDERSHELYRLAAALQHLGCEQALYLDGTLSTWYIPTVSSTFHWTHLVGIIAITDTPP